MTYDDWQTVLSPKVQGTWNLHNALNAHNLDFFVMLSSLSGLAGASGQTNYAAANTFLDALQQYRRHLGLPASVIDIGAVEDVGYVSQSPAALKQFQATNVKLVTEQSLLRALEIAILQSNQTPTKSNGGTDKDQILIGLSTPNSLLDPTSRCPWKRDVRMSVYRTFENTVSSAATTAGNESLKGFLTATASNPSLLAETSSLEFLSREIGSCLCSFIQMPVEELDVNCSLTAMGIDSLLAIEIRNWWRQTLGVEVTTLEILGSENVYGLGKIAVEGLTAKYAAPEKSDGEKQDTYLLMKAP